MVEFIDHRDSSEVSSASPKRFPRQVLNTEDRGVMWIVPDNFEPEYAELVYSCISAHLNNERFSLDEQGIISIKYEGNDEFSFSINLPHRIHMAHILGTFEGYSLSGKLKKEGAIKSSKIVHDRNIFDTEEFLNDHRIHGFEGIRSREKADALYFFEQYGLENGGDNILNRFDEKSFSIPQVMRKQTEQLKERLLKKYEGVLAKT